MDYWKPNATVAAVIERDGRFLMIEERTRDGLRLNQPAGHLDPGETLVQAVERETLEETGFIVTAMAGSGIYMSRYTHDASGADVTYMRFAFACRPVIQHKERPLDRGVVRTLWLSADDIRARSDMHRSPVVMQTIDDYLKGKRFPLDLIYTHESCVYSFV